jgi:hypothetical protein
MNGWGPLRCKKHVFWLQFKQTRKTRKLRVSIHTDLIMSDAVGVLLQNAIVYEKFRRKEKAEEVYKKIISCYPEDFRPYFNLAVLLSGDRTRLEESISLFFRVIEIKDSVIEAYGAVAALLIKLRRPEEAVSFCTAGLQRDPLDSSCLFNINVALRQVGKISNAIQISWATLLSSCSIVPLAKELQQPRVLQAQQPLPIENSLTIVCVKWGSKYNADYVNRLYGGLLRWAPSVKNVDNPGFRLVCYTDDPDGMDDTIQCYPLSISTKTWSGWWLKAQVFAPHSDINGWVLYLDLDTVICSPWGFIIDLCKNCDYSPSCSYSNILWTLSADQFQNEGI